MDIFSGCYAPGSKRRCLPLHFFSSTAPPPVAPVDPSRWIQVSRSHAKLGLLNGPSGYRMAHTLPGDQTGITYPPCPKVDACSPTCSAVLLDPSQSPLGSTDGSLASDQPPSSTTIPLYAPRTPLSLLLILCHVIIHEPLDPLPNPPSVDSTKAGDQVDGSQPLDPSSSCCSAFVASQHAAIPLSFVLGHGKSSLADPRLQSSGSNQHVYSQAP
ncbi:hypothetical protein AMTRI_Chr10g231280 [Amborella trichopoda]